MNVIDLTCLTQNQVVKLNAISSDLISEFNSISGSMMNLHPTSVDWLIHSVNSRNLNHSDLFLNLCFIELLKSELTADHTYDLLIVPEKAFFLTLKKHSELFYLKKLKIRVKENNNSQNGIVRFFKNALKLFRMYRSRSSNRRNEIETKGIYLVDTFILQNSVKAEKYIDRYYNGMLDSLSDETRNKVYFVPTIIPIYNRNKIDQIHKNSDVKLLFHCDFLKGVDYLFAFTYSLRLIPKRLKKNSIKFKGVDLKLLVNSELNNKWSDYMLMRSLLNYRFMKRLSQAGVKLKLVVDWFENQSIDKGLNLGVKHYYPGVVTKGYQGYIISTKYNFFVQPTVEEAKLNLIPDEILVPGKDLIPLIKQFNPRLMVKEAPAFRFSGVWNKADIKPEQGQTKILVALPIGQKELREILNLVFQAVKSDSALSPYKFLVKAHPTTDINKVKAEYGNNWPENVEIKEGDFTKILCKSDLLISNSSSVCLEAITFGKPVIIIGSQSTITQNPIPDTISSNVTQEVYTAGKLSFSIMKLTDYANQNPQELEKISENVRRRYFEPVDVEKVQEIFR